MIMFDMFDVPVQLKFNLVNKTKKRSQHLRKNSFFLDIRLINAALYGKSVSLIANKTFIKIA